MRYYPILLMMLLAVCGCTSNRASEDQLRSEISRIPMLYTVEAEVEVLVEGHGENGTAEWKAMFGTRDIILPVRANIKAGIDLSKITQLEVDGDKVYVTLPDPEIEVESTEIPWGEVVSSVTGLRDEFSNREKEFLTNKGKQDLIRQIEKLDIVVPAQEHAEQILTTFFNRMGYKPVFRTRPLYSESDFIRFVN